MIRKMKQPLEAAFVIILAAAFIILSFSQYSGLLNQSFADEAQNDLSISTRQNADMANEKIKAVVSSMETLSQAIDEKDVSLNDGSAFVVLDKVKESNGLSAMAVAMPDGTCRFDEGSELQISDRTYFQKSMENKTVISDLVISRLNGNSCIIISVPVFRNSKVVGTINALLSTKEMNQLLQIKTSDQQGVTYMVEKSGGIISASKPQYDHGSIFADADLSVEKKNDINQMKADIENGKAGSIYYASDKMKYLVNYAPVGINGWYIINAIPSSVVTSKSNRILGYTGLLAFKLIGVLLLLGAYVFLNEKKNKNALRRTNEELNRTKAELETFVAGLPGGAFRYRADEKTEFQFVSDGLLKIFDYSKEEFVQRFDNSFENMIYEEDREKTLNNIRQQIKKGRFAEVKYRIATADKCIRWLLNRAQLVTAVDGHSEFYAVAVDITDSKKAHKRAKDAMTQLETLSNSIPGGVAQFSYDEGVMTLIYASEGFYKLSGYAKEEYAQLTNGEGIWHAHPDDLHHLNSIMNKQINAEAPLSAEYRLSRKDGSIIWVSLCGTRTVNSRNQVIYQCIFTDITSFKNTQQELELGKERYEIAENLSDDILFEYDILTDYLELSPLFTALTGRYPRISNFSKEIYHDEIIHFDDLPEVKNFLREVRLGHSESGVEFRFKTRSGEYIWHRIKIKIIFDAHGEPSKMIGKAYNIDAQKKEMQRLTDKSQRDPLTNLFNKIATQSQIEDDLKEAGTGSKHALMMIDIDDFKSVNDNFGHMEGDMVITEISSKLQMLFRTSDVVGRIGGDEFIVFLRDISTDHMIAEKAKAIGEIFRNTHEGKQLDYKISGSIGIALYPADGTTYQELFPKADLALYRAKNLGKDCYAFYSDELHSNL